MKFLADMNISMDTVRWLRGKGYDIVHLSEQRLLTMEDIDIMEKAKNEERIILTCDLDFAHLLAESNQAAPSVILFRLEYQTPKNHISIIDKILSKYLVRLLEGALVVADDTRIRARSLPMF
jgi:predicted nuclease of predicted toxin-antitoxin system